MSALLMIRDWRRQVQDELLPEMHGHQSKALADLSFAMVNAKRLERTLANERLDPDSAWPQLARSVLNGWAGGPILLILDETPNHNDLRCMKITLAYRK
jgi:hypothetical protein